MKGGTNATIGSFLQKSYFLLYYHINIKRVILEVFMRFFILFFSLNISLSSLFAYDFVRHTENLDSSCFFNTTFVNNYAAVKETLIRDEGFTEVFFKTPNNHILQGLFRRVENPDFTILFCSGFVPGKQEGIATFLTMLPKNCNILFFNGHGKGKSSGKLSFLNLINYGRFDYFDTIGAIQFAHLINHGPLFIHGICAGAFHAAHALIQLKNETEYYNIKGFICDSIWSSVDTITVGIFEDALTRARSLISRTGLNAGKLFARFVAAPLVRQYSHETNLLPKISQLTIPTLFIHAYDDTLAHIAPAQLLAQQVVDKQVWWIEEKSKHACHHLKHKYTYAQKLKDFICTHI